jgi:hypothetical protein
MLARETWWRGTAVGVSPAKAGSVAHDFGDGLYLSDQPAVARQYATLRADEIGAGAGAQQLFRADLDPSKLGKVLDLRTDPRWARFASSPSHPGSTMTNADLMKIPDNYPEMFNAWARENGIKVGDYDAIIGPEYVRGGSQICIRNPAAQAQVRAAMKPIAVAAESAALEGAAAGEATGAETGTAAGLRAGGKAGSAVRGIGGALVGIVIGIAIGWLAAKYESKRIAKALADKQTEIESKVAGLGTEVARLRKLFAPATIWAVVTIRLDYAQGWQVDPIGWGGASYYQTFTQIGEVRAEASTAYTDTSSTGMGMPGFATSGTQNDAWEWQRFSIPIAYDPAGMTPDQIDARITANETDAARASMPVHVMEALFEEREALLEARHAPLVLQ